MGALIASRRPHNPIGWICLAVGLLWMLGGLGEQYTAYGIAKPGSVPFVATIVALIQWTWIIPVGLLGTYLLLLFPDGMLPSSRWRPLAWLSGAVMVLLGVDSVLAPGPLTDLEGVRNPFGLEGAPWLVDAGIVLLLLFVTCIVASAVSLVSRYRRSGGEVREQIKWIALAGSFVGLLAFLGIILGLLIVPEVMRGGGGSLPLWLQFLIYVMNLSFAGVPVAIGFAILRYRLYDIDQIINRTLVYGALSASLALVYFGGVATTQAIFRALTGQEQQPQLAVVVSTLVIAALFTPLRHRIQAFIDRRFYRRKYDARNTLEALRAPGKPVMMLFTDPGCGPCNAMLPEVGRWQEEHAQELTLALVSRGEVEENKTKASEHGLSNMLLQEDWEVSESYEVKGTPSALLVSSEGKVASPVAGGAEGIKALLSFAVGERAQLPMQPQQPQAQGQPCPNCGKVHAAAPTVPAAQKVGEEAPDVKLPNLEGNTVELADFRGEQTLVLFWNTGCGFCQQMLPDLKEWVSEAPESAPRLVVVSARSEEANKEMGLASPVLLDQNFATGRAFGASGTPSAVLVDAEGKVASEVAVGAPAVMELAGADRTTT